MLKTGATPDVGQAPAGHWETGHLAGAGAGHHPAQARHQTPQHSDKHLSRKHCGEQFVIFKQLLEEFSKVTAAKEKDRTSVKFQDKTTNSQKFRTKLRTALPKSPDLTCQLTSLTFGTKVRTLYKTTNSQARFT